MQKVGIWRVTPDGLRRANESRVDLERHLEEWIERDPSLVRAGLTIVGRQLRTASGPLDLLALEPQGRWVIIEVKRGVLRRESIAQAIDYASCIAELSDADMRELIDGYLRQRQSCIEDILEERDLSDALDRDRRQIALIVVGVGREAGLERMSRYLVERFEMPISIVSFEVFDTGDGGQIVAREITEPEDTPVKSSRGAGVTIESVVRIAEQGEHGQAFKHVLDAAQEVGLYVRTWRTSLMFAPQSNRSRMIFTMWAHPSRGKLRLYVSPDAVAEFFPISVEEAASFIGANGWRYFSADEALDFSQALRSMFALIDGARGAEDARS